MFPFGQFIIVCGHYGCGKTNLSLNLAVNLQKAGRKVTLVDLDLVNPYFRSSDFPEILRSNQIELIAPVFAHSNLDLPALPENLHRIFSMTDRTVIIDVGGDDAGATALGSVSQSIRQMEYQMLYVVNRYRALTQTPAEACALLREIESACRLKATGVVNNSHMQGETTPDDILRGVSFAEKTAELLDLPLAFTTVPAFLAEKVGKAGKNVYPVEIYVKPPWEQ